MTKWFFARSAYTGCSYYRQFLPLKHNLAWLAKHGDVKVKFSANMKDSLDADVCFFSRNIGAQNLSAIIRLKDMGKMIVWDCDDDLTIPSRFVQKDQSYVTAEIGSFLMCMEIADVITVSTEPLADRLGHPQKTVVLPNLIDLCDWPIADRITRAEKVILYAGTATHAEDLELIKDLYRETCTAYPWVFFGCIPNWATRIATCVPLTSLQSYPNVCRLLNPLFVLAPLMPNRFNECKSPIKVWESATTGAHVIASNFGPYAGKPSGIIPSGSVFSERDLRLDERRRQKCLTDATANSWQCAGEPRAAWRNFFHRMIHQEALT